MTRARFEVIDDPLAVTAGEDRQHETGGRSPAPETRNSRRPRRQAQAKGSDPTAATSSDRQRERIAGGEVQWDPPDLDEPLTLVATRLPRSLDRALEEHTQQLRRRRNGASQKKLAKQEVLAMAIWALGDPDNERTGAIVEALYEQYRGRRLAAAGAAAIEAARLGESVDGFGEPRGS